MSVNLNENPLGRIVLHDPRSRDYAFPRTAPIASKSVTHRMGSKNVDQFYLGSCVGHSGANMLNCAMAARSRQQFNKYSPGRYRAYLDNNDGILNYSESTKRDPFSWVYPPTDAGSSALGLMKFWQEIGVITAYRWAFTFDQFLAALQTQPVLVGSTWYDSMMHPDRRGIVTPAGVSVGGHEYLATGILWHDKLIRFENSWGENWGLRGAFYMRFDHVAELLGDNGDVAVPTFL